VPEARLSTEFFNRSVHQVARELIGCQLFFDGVGGTIVETESYERDDPACHAYVGLTERTRVLFGPPGRAYVYLSYGIHSLLNAVAEPEGDAAAVLIRALEPSAGQEAMRSRRGPHLADTDLCSGPGKLTEALGITLAQNDTDLTRPPFLLTPPPSEPPAVVVGPRIGITKATDCPWRFSALANPHVSKPRPPD
jgi:DNA-3-methyladenine glycosylase